MNTPSVPDKFAGLKRLDSLSLADAAVKHRSVIGVVGWCHTPRPATWITRMQWHTVEFALEKGLYLYEPKRKGAKHEMEKSA